MIRVDQISKRYLRGDQGRGPYVSLRDVVTEAAGAAFRRLRAGRTPRPAASSGASHSAEFWALRDISFAIGRGERVGIIGRNGAGKSTLLKLIGRVTEPSEGKLSIKGRVASLLEVGTGFHPDLSGRENVFLYGATLGMSRREICDKFEEIVAFAEVERFLDTPVKRYSSGMYLRLAFAVAAHLDAEIVLLDEVLAVGDVSFQKKCIQRMEAISQQQGRTLLFVTHNLELVRQLCARCILLERGRKAADGPTDEVLSQYTQSINGTAPLSSTLSVIAESSPPDPVFRVENALLLQSGIPVEGMVSSDQPIEVEVSYQVLEETTGLRVYFDLRDEAGLTIIRSFHDELAPSIPTMAPGAYVSKAQIPANLLAPRTYELVVNCGIFNVRSCMPVDALRVRFRVSDRTKERHRLSGEQPRLAPSIGWHTTKDA